jgi:Trypsin-like peptidase domain
MTDGSGDSLAVQPILAFPREAETGRQYLFTVDLRPQLSGDQWPYPEREEIVVRCRVNGGTAFRAERVGDGAVVIHRFGGSYGPARFLLSALEGAQSGLIKVTLFNAHGFPMTVLETPVIRVHSRSTNARPSEPLKFLKDLPALAVPPLSPPKEQDRLSSGHHRTEQLAALAEAMPGQPLTPELRMRLVDVLTAAFGPRELKRFVRMRLQFDDVNFAMEVNFSQPTKNVAFELIDVAERYGHIIDLVNAIHQMRPRRPDVADLMAAFGLETPVRAEKAEIKQADAITVHDGLERMIKSRLPAFDFAAWREKLATVEGTICGVELDGGAVGTGFLVGPAAVLTNYHVLQPVLEGKIASDRVVFRFDYKRLSTGAPSRTTDAKLKGADWRLDRSLPSKDEERSTPDRTLPTPDELDYVLVALERELGNEPTLNRVGTTAPKRGWLTLPTAPVELPTGAPLLIAQHPSGKPLKLSIETDAVIGVNANRTRVRYTNNTEPGSSGSPVFDLQWNLVALHHLGDPAFGGPPGYNQGVLIDRIRERIEANGQLEALGAAESLITAPTVQLRDEIEDELNGSFSVDELELFAARRLVFDSVKFADEVNFKTPKSQTVSEIVSVAERHGLVEELILALYAECPTRPGTRALMQKVGIAIPGPQADIPREVVKAITTFKEQFVAPSQGQLKPMLALMRLRQALHKLSNEFGGLVSNVEEIRRLPNISSDPDDVVNSLSVHVEDAKAIARELDIPPRWVDRLERAVKDLSAEVHKRDRAAMDGAIIDRSLETIKQIPASEQKLLNARLMERALGIKPLETVKQTDAVLAVMVQSNASDPVSNTLRNEFAQLRIQCRLLDYWIELHNSCQEIDGALQGAVGENATSLETLSRWDDIRSRAREMEEKTRQLLLNNRRLTNFRHDIVAFEQSVEAMNRAQSDDEKFEFGRLCAQRFNRLKERFNDLFENSDGHLVEVTSTLINTAKRLQEMLKGF